MRTFKSTLTAITVRSLANRLWLFVQRLSKEQWLMVGFVTSFLIVVIRLVQLQIIDFQEYQNKLISQHFQHVNIKAKRGNILLESPSGKPIQLTTTTQLFDVFVDPKFVVDKGQFIEELYPVLMKHLCGMTGDMVRVDMDCIAQVERYVLQPLLPKKPVVYYLGSGISWTTGLSSIPETASGWQELRDRSVQLLAEYQSGQSRYQEDLARVLSGTSVSLLEDLVKKRLDDLIYIGKKPRNFVAYVETDELRQAIEKADLPYLIIDSNALYILVDKVTDLNRAGSDLYSLLSKHNILFSYRQLRNLLSPQENRYVRLMNNVNHEPVEQLKKRKAYRQEQQQLSVYNKKKSGDMVTEQDLVPLLHGLGFEEKTARLYPFGDYLAHVLGFVDKQGKALYGVEEYRDEYLKGQDGQIIGFGTPRIGQVGSNELQLSNPINGSDIVLTIEPNIQKELEMLTKKYLSGFRADSVSITVMNPYDGSVVGLANAPTFDPNNPDAIYKVEPLEPSRAFLVDDPQYLDIPVYYNTGGKTLPMTLTNRLNSLLPKYINANYYGPLAFLDKNTSLAYEPGSIFKPITTAIGMDIDEISLYDMYYDKGELQVGDYFIKNVSQSCLGNNTILHALQFSCNIGMIHIIQKIGKYAFYNYLEKLGLGRPTGIEIAGEVPGWIPDAQIQQKSRFFNNSFGQGLLVTPMQMAVSYSALVNGGYLVKPTIVKKIIHADGQVKQLTKTPKKKIFTDFVSSEIKNALFEVVNGGQIKKFALKGKTLAGKTGTPQISFRGKYQNGVGWTNGSFAGIVTRDNTKYVIVIQVRRPRTSQWGETTAGQIYGELARFLVQYEDIDT